VTDDHYAGAAAGWSSGATLVYQPIASSLVARAPIELAGTAVMDTGAGTGACEAPLRGAGVSSIVEVDLSFPMLRWDRGSRPPGVVADVTRLPFPRSTFDVAVASFVLNHLTEPVRALQELARVVRGGGGVLATVFSNRSASPVRDAIDATARNHGWVPPGWYVELKTRAAPILGASAPMSEVAIAAGLVDVETSDDAVDVGLTEPDALVDYRFGQAQFAGWLARLTPEECVAARHAAVQAIADTMEPYRPRVVFLVARTAS
jgi:SAM-dependent methyltransferase